MKTKTTHTDKKDMKRTHTNWSDNSNHSLWLIRRKKLQIVVSLGELFLFVAYWTMIPFCDDPDFFPQIPIFCWSDPDFSYQLSGRSAYMAQCNQFLISLMWLKWVFCHAHDKSKFVTCHCPLVFRNPLFAFIRPWKP